MPTLVDLGKKYTENPTDEFLFELGELSEVLNSDPGNPHGRAFREIIQDGDIKSKESFASLLGAVRSYAEEAVIGRAFNNDFEEPEEVEEMADLKFDKRKRIVITRGGNYYEINEAKEEIGPLTETHDPAPGHPEYEQKIREVETAYGGTIGFYTPQSGVNKYTPQPEIGGILPYHPQPIPGDISIAPPKPIVGKIHNHSDLPAVLDWTPQPAVKKPLVTVSLDLPQLGGVEYEVEEVISDQFMVTLVFDPSRAKPNFTPKVGLKFELTHGREKTYVMYVGTKFSYIDKMFLSFSKIALNKAPTAKNPSEEESTMDYYPGEDEDDYD